jgi:hypothetical protein
LQVPLLQVAGATQSAVVVQLVRQAVGPHTYFKQELELPATQLCEASHVEEVVKVEPMQVAGTQTVPTGQTAQVPAPEQTPVAAQDAWGLPMQAPLGLDPATLLVQVPAAPGALHCSQPLVQAALQQ